MIEPRKRRHCGGRRSSVYLYDVRGMSFYGVRGFWADNEWLVLFGGGGIMETAFPPENMDEYLESPCPHVPEHDHKMNRDWPAAILEGL